MGTLSAAGTPRTDLDVGIHGPAAAATRASTSVTNQPPAGGVLSGGRRQRSLRIRTTEARRFPPPSGPGNVAQPTRQCLPPAHRRLGRQLDGFAPGEPSAVPGDAGHATRERARPQRPSAGSAAGEQGDDLQGVERGVEADAAYTDRRDRNTQPSATPTGSSATNENNARCAPVPNEASNSVTTWARAQTPHPDIACRAPQTRAHAVVANPRKNSSSPIGASTAADTRLAASPRPSPRPPAAGSAPVRGTRRGVAEEERDPENRDRDQGSHEEVTHGLGGRQAKPHLAPRKGAGSDDQHPDHGDVHQRREHQ